MASKKMDKLKEAGAGMDKFFSGADQAETEEKEEIRVTVKGDGERIAPPVYSTPKVTKSLKMEEKKPAKGRAKTVKEELSESPQKAQKKVFSFRAEVDQVDSWRVWADAKGLKVDELGEKAITEYIKRHGLTEDQRQIYELKMAQKKS